MIRAHSPLILLALVIYGVVGCGSKSAPTPPPRVDKAKKNPNPDNGGGNGGGRRAPHIDPIIVEGGGITYLGGQNPNMGMTGSNVGLGLRLPNRPLPRRQEGGRVVTDPIVAAPVPVTPMPVPPTCDDSVEEIIFRFIHSMERGQRNVVESFMAKLYFGLPGRVYGGIQNTDRGGPQIVVDSYSVPVATFFPDGTILRNPTIIEASEFSDKQLQDLADSRACDLKGVGPCILALPDGENIRTHGIGVRRWKRDKRAQILVGTFDEETSNYDRSGLLNCGKAVIYSQAANLVDAQETAGRAREETVPLINIPLE